MEPWNWQHSQHNTVFIYEPNPSLFIFLLINNYISLIEIKNLIKKLLSLNCQ